MLSLQAQDIQRSYLMHSLPVPHPQFAQTNYNYYADNFSTVPYEEPIPYNEPTYHDEPIYSPQISPAATPELDSAGLFSPYFSFDIRSPSASPRPGHQFPCSPKTTTTLPVSRRPSTIPPAVPPTDPITTTASPPPPPPPSPQHLDVAPRRCPSSVSVEQALEIARESREGAADPTVRRILERALAETWSRVETMRGAYVMSKGEFAVFNFFQNRFAGSELAVLARRRYWEGR